MYDIYTEKKRLPVNWDEVPEHLNKATLALDDANFYKHGGFDIKGLARGLYRTIIEKRLQGGSTLTQQLVKNGLLTPERTLSRKFKEAVLTVATEVMYSKDEILEMYFNQVPYGGTTWGAEAAAQTYFGKDVTHLTLAESAFLAGLPQAPSIYSPYSQSPNLWKNRQKDVLERMVQLKFITKDQAKKTPETKSQRGATMSVGNKLQQQAETFRRRYQAVFDQIQRAIVGHGEIIHGVLTCLFVGGHCLLEGVPGLGKTLLIRTYSGALAQVGEQTVVVKPLRAAPEDTDVLVRTEVRGRGDPVQLDYRLEKTPGEGAGWKIYNLNVLGVWLVETYRSQFAQEINARGIDGLIETLEARNKSNAAKG